MADTLLTLKESSVLKKAKLVEGKNLVHTFPDGSRLLATVRNKQVLRWYAIDKKGTRLKVNLIKIASGAWTGRIICEVCVLLPNGQKHCYEIDCDNVPKPKSGFTHR
jgi:hypothetical protein